MSKIRILSPQEACKIAAGEVVERPANVVKELVENALDAGATQIEVYLSKAGKQLIRVVDNGCGMSAEDAKICFAHHATSKIETVLDLENLQSFGFRGEALSSIAAVSKVTLLTCEAGSLSGTKTQVEGGILIDQAKVAAAVGTDLRVENLFYNLPARQKFLKQDDTEWRQILQLFTAFGFAYPSVHFQLYHDDRLVHNCPAAADLKERVMQLWGAGVGEGLLDLQAAKDQILITGMISNHQTFRYQRTQIFCFVNQRLVRNHGLVKGLLKGYSNVFPEGKYPLAILFFELPLAEVDVNVHPRKEEVSFLHPRRIETLLTEAVKKRLETNIAQYLRVPTPAAFTSAGYQANLGPSWSERRIDYNVPVSSFANMDRPVIVNKSLHRLETAKDVLSQTDENALQQRFVERNYELIGQLHQTYIMISKAEGLLLVDQHAAHERVMYERFRARFENVATVGLMFPATITLTAREMQLLEPHLGILKTYGILAEVFGVDQIIIQSIPDYLKQVQLGDVIRQLAAWIEEFQQLEATQLHQIVNEKMHAQMACKAAIKAGDILSTAQMYELLDSLEKVEQRLTCPHGRPTSWLISLSEIEKKFKRKL